jgi:hypothetical protein
MDHAICGLPFMAGRLQHLALVVVRVELGADVRAHGLVHLSVARRAHAHAAARLLAAVLRRVGAFHAVAHVWGQEGMGFERL